MAARLEAQQAIIQHLNLCPFATQRIEQRLRNLELSYARLIGIMVGAGLIGGASGGTLSAWLSR